jgi:predicted nucleotidyltransferase
MEINVPKEYESDLKLAYDYLKSVGCTEVFIFGSLAENNYNSSSDIDLAVKGLDKSKFFHVYGELMKLLNHPFDLVGLDYNNDFSQELLKSGTLKRVS